MKSQILTFIVAILLFANNPIFSQSPGFIIRPAAGGTATILNPDGNAYTSVNSSGFQFNDMTESEIPYKMVPAVIQEPTGDLATGPTGGFTDLVSTPTNSGFYIYNDGTNLLFRLRIGSVISGSKGYSILIDTDGKIGGTGPNADPDYISPTNTAKGNPGFEFEILFATNTNVIVNNVNGLQNPIQLATYPLSTNSQISVALTFDSDNPDYFYDFAVPLSIIGNPISFRLAATTVTSPNSALQGTRSDIYGLPDGNYSSVSQAWERVITAQPAIVTSQITSSGSGVQPVCTEAPTITNSIPNGNNVAVTGQWNRLDDSKPATATIFLYRNGLLAGTTSVSTGTTWTITVPTISAGDIIYAQAQSTGESACLQSASITAGCTTPVASPVLTCASSKGISGTIPVGATVIIYKMPADGSSPLSTPITTNIAYGAGTFSWFQPGCSGGSNNVDNGTYIIYAVNGGCLSQPVFECVANGSSSLTGLTTNTSITLTNPIYANQTSITGTGAVAGNNIRLFINGRYISTLTATATTFSFSGLSLKTGDVVRLYVSAGTNCTTVSTSYTVSCYSEPPTIINNGGNLTAGLQTISGSSIYSGATVQLFQGVAPTGTPVGSTATTSANGSWSVSGVTLSSGQSYYARITANGCQSAGSGSISTLAATTICATITGTYTANATLVSGTFSTAFTGTVRLYIDDVIIGSQIVTGATGWSIPVNTNSTNILYTGGVLKVSTQTSGATENRTCPGQVVVSCATPSQPVFVINDNEINLGETVTVTISNSQNGILYSLKDANSSTYFASSGFGNGGNLLLTSQPFTVAGSYNLEVQATSLSGPGCISSSTTSLSVGDPLPLTLLSFTGTVTNQNVQLKWKTADEYQVEMFVIEKSTDGRMFNSIANIPAQNRALNFYQFADPDKLFVNTYYRLKMMDLDGSFKTSNTILLKTFNAELNLVVYPNPFIDHVIINYPIPEKKFLKISLYNTSGNLIRTWDIGNLETNSYQLSGLNSLLAGVYYLEIIEKNGTRFYKKIMK